MIIDGDSHMYELPSLWEERLSAAERHLALRIEPDELGYSFLTYAGQRLMMVVPTVPSDPGRSGEVRQRYAAGLPAVSDLYDEVPRDYWDPAARVGLLDLWGIDEAVVFPHFQVIIESALRDDGDDVPGQYERVEPVGDRGDRRDPRQAASGWQPAPARPAGVGRRGGAAARRGRRPHGRVRAGPHRRQAAVAR